MIVLQRVSRWYGQVIGINDVSCRIGPGLTALLGPNGAGKSTFLKLVTGQLRPTTGVVHVFGQRPFANTTVFRRLGYCPEIESCYEDMTGSEFVRFLARMAGIPARELNDRVGQAMETVGMVPFQDRRIASYSKGMRQRIKIAQAIVHDPDLLVLDEPLTGLDPVGRREIGDLLVRMAGAGKCVLVSSHILYEVEQMTRNIVLMDRGRIRAMGDIYRIRELIDAHPHRVSLVTDRPRDLAARLLALPHVISVRFDAQDDRRLEVETVAPDQFYDELPRLILSDGYRVTSFESPDNNLEAVFRYLVKG